MLYPVINLVDLLSFMLESKNYTLSTCRVLWTFNSHVNELPYFHTVFYFTFSYQNIGNRIITFHWICRNVCTYSISSAAELGASTSWGYMMEAHFNLQLQISYVLFNCMYMYIPYFSKCKTNLIHDDPPDKTCLPWEYVFIQI